MYKDIDKEIKKYYDKILNQTKIEEDAYQYIYDESDDWLYLDDAPLKRDSDYWDTIEKAHIAGQRRMLDRIKQYIKDHDGQTYSLDEMISFLEK